jgi:hypothetical protein
LWDGIVSILSTIPHKTGTGNRPLEPVQNPGIFTLLRFSLFPAKLKQNGKSTPYTPLGIEASLGKAHKKLSGKGPGVGYL